MTRLYYFVGGPLPGAADEFFKRLSAAGGSPPGWAVYPHAARDGKALHVVEATSVVEITAHLDQFADIYRYGPIVEIVKRA